MSRLTLKGPRGPQGVACCFKIVIVESAKGTPSKISLDHMCYSN